MTPCELSPQKLIILMRVSFCFLNRELSQSSLIRCRWDTELDFTYIFWLWYMLLPWPDWIKAFFPHGELTALGESGVCSKNTRDCVRQYVSGLCAGSAEQAGGGHMKVCLMSHVPYCNKKKSSKLHSTCEHGLRVTLLTRLSTLSWSWFWCQSWTAWFTLWFPSALTSRECFFCL